MMGWRLISGKMREKRISCPTSTGCAINCISQRTTFFPGKRVCFVRERWFNEVRLTLLSTDAPPSPPRKIRMRITYIKKGKFLLFQWKADSSDVIGNRIRGTVSPASTRRNFPQWCKWGVIPFFLPSSKGKFRWLCGSEFVSEPSGDCG